MATVVIGTEVNGAKLWIRFGGYQIQPGEFAKVLLVVFIAGYLRENREVLERPSRRVMGVGLPALRHLLPLLAMWGIALVLLVAVNDFGSSLLYYSILLAMLYLATGRWLYVGGGIVAFVVGAFAAVQAAPHVQDRIDIWIDPWATPRTTGYQIVQSLYSIADGGIFGTGFGRGFVLVGKQHRHPRRPDRLHLLGDRLRDRARRRRRAAARLPGVRLPRHEDRRRWPMTGSRSCSRPGCRSRSASRRS